MAQWVRALAAKSLYQNPRGGRIELTPESGPLTRMNVHAHAHTGTHMRARTHTYVHRGEEVQMWRLFSFVFLKKERSEI